MYTVTIQFVPFNLINLYLCQVSEIQGDFFGNLEKFVMEPADQHFHYNCRITRYRKEMDRVLIQTYFLNL